MSARGCVVWLTGLPSSGKSTLALRVRSRLIEAGQTVALLDGDAVRAALVPPPGYDDAARDGFYATLGKLAALLARQGLIVLVPATAHRRGWREQARGLAPAFLEVYVRTDFDECRRRDTKGLYHRSPAALPGAGITYEPPPAPDVSAGGGHDDGAVATIVKLIQQGGST